MNWYIAGTLIAILSVISALMAVMVRLMTAREAWGTSTWLAVYLASALAIGLIWLAVRGFFLPGSVLP